jgi:CheY-like chemotaxis protein
MKAPSPKYLSVLLADDDDDDRLLFHDAILEIDAKVDLQMVKTGEELMQYLLTSAVFLPEILFLDLNMPGKNGFDCLEEIRRDRTLRELFVIIYSTTTSPREIEEVFTLGADLFVSKPNSFTGLKKLLAQLLTIDLRAHIAGGGKKNFVFNATL